MFQVFHSSISSYLICPSIWPSTHPPTNPSCLSINPIKLYPIFSCCQALYLVLKMYHDPDRLNLSPHRICSLVLVVSWNTRPGHIVQHVLWKRLQGHISPEHSADEVACKLGSDLGRKCSHVKGFLVSGLTGVNAWGETACPSRTEKG